MLYNVFALMIICILLMVILAAHKSDLRKSIKLWTETIGSILLVCTTLTILFLDAIAVGIIGLVPG